MAETRRFGIINIALLALGVAATLCAACVAVFGRFASNWHWTAAILGVVVVLLCAAMLVFWRSLNMSLSAVAAETERLDGGGDVLPMSIDMISSALPVAGTFNGYARKVQDTVEKLRARNRELELQSRIIAAEKAHTEAIIFSISDAVIVTNRFDELVLANEAAEHLLGFTLSRSMRSNIEKVISDETLVKLIRETRLHGKNSSRRTLEHVIERDGNVHTFNVTISCVTTVANEVSGVVVVMHDVTREKEISRMKTDFVSNVTHELKTPLASIKAYIEMLIDGEASDEVSRNEFYEIISTETERLHRLIENILNISRIESGLVKVVREPISLTAVVKHVLDVALPQAKAKSITIDERLAPVYYQVEADRDMIYQAVMNLVSNAIKYTPNDGKITVSLAVNEDRGVAVCKVADTGVGIPADDLPHVFEKFYRVSANNKMAKGTGLGLTLAKHIVETIHSGKMWVDSEAGKGSTFSFELPIIA